MKMSSISQQSPNQMLKLVDSNRLVEQRVRVKPQDKLVLKTSETCSSWQNSMENLWDLSSDFNVNSNVDDLLDLGNTQMSSIFREFSSSGGSNEDHQWKEEKQNATTCYKTIKGLGFYSCDSCPFLCLNVKSFLEHKDNDHHFHHSPLKSLLRTKCVGCDNIFYSFNVLRCHLIEDHDVLSAEVEELIQLVIEANKEDISYMNDSISQTEQNNLTQFNNNDILLDSLKFGQKSHFVNTETQITETNHFIENGGDGSNEITEDFWDCHKQVFNGLQEINANNKTNIIEKRFRCTVGTCKLKFATEYNLKYHESCHTDHVFQCAEFECHYINSKWSSIMSHLWKSHSIDIEMFNCDQCEFKTNSLYKLNTFHKTTHRQEKPFLCPKCNKGFKSIKQLRNHKSIHSKVEKPTKNDLECGHCSRNFSTKSLLHQHISTVHKRVRPYSCNICNYMTGVASSLRLHMRLHTGEKPFKCEECDFTTADHNTLRKHKMRHSGQKNYSCSLCTYSCIQASSYKKHIKTKHPGMDDGLMYSCDMCNFKTIRKDIYMQHIVKHKEETSKTGICQPLVSLDEIFNEEEKIQSENVELEQSNILFNTIRVKPLNTMKVRNADGEILNTF